MGRPREHGPETRDRLLAAAERVLAEEGVGALSARRLAGEVGVTTRAIYSLFDGMPAVLAGLYRRGFEILVQAIDDVPREDDAVAEIRALGDAYRRFAQQRPELYQLMFERVVPWYTPDGDDFAFAARGLGRLRNAVDRGLSQRNVDRDVDRTTYQLWVILHGHVSIELSGFPGPADAAWQDTVSTVLTGFFDGTCAQRRPHHGELPAPR